MIQTRNLSGYHLVDRSIRTWYFTLELDFIDYKTNVSTF